ncbi:uncharacterized protein METZ01_LOCUS440384, partial [marine metagenome]
MSPKRRIGQTFVELATALTQADDAPGR